MYTTVHPTSARNFPSNRKLKIPDEEGKTLGPSPSPKLRPSFIPILEGVPMTVLIYVDTTPITSRSSKNPILKSRALGIVFYEPRRRGISICGRQAEAKRSIRPGPRRRLREAPCR